MKEAADDSELRNLLSSRRESSECRSSQSVAGTGVANLRKDIPTLLTAPRRPTRRGLSPGLPSHAVDLPMDRNARESSALLDACDRSSSVMQSNIMGSTPSLNRRGPSRDRRRIADRTRPSDDSEFTDPIKHALLLQSKNTE